MKYKQEQLSQYRGLHKRYYWIPPDWILRDDVPDDIKKNGIYVFSRWMPEKLNYYTNGRYNSQDWFDYWILGITDPLDRPRCHNPKCNKILNFVSLSKGYSRMEAGCTKFLYCSLKCSVNHRYIHPEDYPEFTEFMENGGGAGLMYADPENHKSFIEHVKSGSGWGVCHRSPEIYGKIGFGNKETHKIQGIRSRFTNFMGGGGLTDTCYFYIATTFYGYFKFGITSDMRTRSSYGDYKNYKIILESTRLIIALLEFIVKLDLDTEEESQDFDLRNILRFSKSYNKALRFLNSDQVRDLTSTTISKESTPEVRWKCEELFYTIKI